MDKVKPDNRTIADIENALQSEKEYLADLESQLKLRSFVPSGFSLKLGESKSRIINLTEELLNERTRALIELVRHDLKDSELIPDELNLRALVSQECIADPLCRINELAETARSHLVADACSISKMPDKFASQVFVDSFKNVIIARDKKTEASDEELEKHFKSLGGLPLYCVEERNKAQAEIVMALNNIQEELEINLHKRIKGTDSGE
ncbi:MAG: hypothetical protein JXA43_02810 [Candidatus Diapherotrites archaeon]|nr:hypothetical protein [Candidatus Diapherotrites archaeon]